MHFAGIPSVTPPYLGSNAPFKDLCHGSTYLTMDIKSVRIPVKMSGFCGVKKMRDEEN